MRALRWLGSAMIVLLVGFSTAALAGAVSFGVVVALIVLLVLLYLSWERRVLERRLPEGLEEG